MLAYRKSLQFAFLLLVLLLPAIVVSAKNCEYTVAANESGDVKTIREAVEKVPADNKSRCTIRIRPGTYNEQIRVPANKPYISFIGEKAETTILTFKISNKDVGSTSAAFATYIGGHDFHAENVTFENSFGTGSQAVAVLVEADRSVFKNCRFLGWQDTLYAKNGRQFYKDSYIEGHVDFIFGQAAAVFESCHIHSKADGYIAAPMRFAADELSGFVFDKCRLTSTDTRNGVYLGRPWRDYGRTVFINTRMEAQIHPEGWHHWEPQREKTAFFGEFGSTGPGASATRVSWARTLTDKDVTAFSAPEFLRGKDGWKPGISSDVWLQANRPDWKLVTWSEVFKQKPLWYQTDEAARIGDQLLLYQKDNGGFEKNIDMALMLTKPERDALAAKKSDIGETTIDNRASYPQVAYLARLITASMLKRSPPANLPKYNEAFNKGLDYLLASQYENGGFPQFFPLKKGYYTHITFNDDAMIGVLKVLREIAKKNEDFKFVDEDRRTKAEMAVEKALPLILKLQVEIDGKKTVWAAQYDEFSLKPAKARAFEPASLTAGESVGIVRFLMLYGKPSPEIVNAIESAIAWYRATKIEGFRWERRATPEGLKYSLVKDKTAPPMWARFYQIETMKPIFIGRDAVIKYNVSDIDPERQNGYAWYVDEPDELLNKDYPKWKAKIDNAR